MKWESYIPAVAEAMQEKGIASIGLLFEQVMKFLDSEDRGSEAFEVQIMYGNLRDTLMGKTLPYNKCDDNQAEYTPVALAVAAFFKRPVEDLFGEIPDEDVWIQVGNKKKVIPRAESVIPMSRHFHDVSRTDQVLEKREFMTVVEDGLLSKLPRETDQLNRDRMVTIIKSRFGFGGPALTFDEAAAYHGITRERIRQIEAKALRRLRHPSVSFNLRPFLNDLEI